MSLLAVPAEILLQPLINEPCETIQFGSLDIGRPLISRRDRKTHHLLHACTRYPKMKSSSSFAHTLAARKAHLPIKFHAENTPALPVTRKDQSGKVLLCPQQDYPATSVAKFCIAVLRQPERSRLKPELPRWPCRKPRSVNVWKK